MSVLELVGTKLFVTLTLGIVGVFFVLNRVCGKKTGKESTGGPQWICTGCADDGIELTKDSRRFSKDMCRLC